MYARIPIPKPIKGTVLFKIWLQTWSLFKLWWCRLLTAQYRHTIWKSVLTTIGIGLRTYFNLLHELAPASHTSMTHNHVVFYLVTITPFKMHLCHLMVILLLECDSCSVRKWLIRLVGDQGHPGLQADPLNGIQVKWPGEWLAQWWWIGSQCVTVLQIWFDQI